MASSFKFLSTVGPEIETVFLPLGNLEASWEGFPNGSVGKESACKAGDIGHDVSSGSLHREDPWRRKCNPLQYSCLENSMDRGAWQAPVHGVTKSWAHLRD